MCCTFCSSRSREVSKAVVEYSMLGQQCLHVTCAFVYSPPPPHTLTRTPPPPPHPPSPHPSTHTHACTAKVGNWTDYGPASGALSFNSGEKQLMITNNDAAHEWSNEWDTSVSKVTPYHQDDHGYDCAANKAQSFAPSPSQQKKELTKSAHTSTLEYFPPSPSSHFRRRYHSLEFPGRLVAGQHFCVVSFPGQVSTASVHINIGVDG
jgi:hypothetical protein